MRRHLICTGENILSLLYSAFLFSFFYSSVCALLMFDDMCRYFPQVGQIVLVTVNYRLGALSFLVTEWAQGNLGLRDQIMALEWVQSNIAFFGGDSGRVTIFGQSAGILSLPASIHLTPLPHPSILSSSAFSLSTRSSYTTC